ncbi:hypothetical protein IP91_00526 [Pseudoduganella lurida]|uniref:Monoheme cytochrome SoxX n=1 Tax=Pseudoduganella lurida TaxID=1036180 RepID=A0A562RK82_9BURK|nr:hypothetical protein [Pseudoduganella lurida]TWI69458.1 hypothetical protein IP91_00526 [Pseudoduganella lurida]
MFANLLAKQLFYVTSDQLHAYQWQHGTLSGPDVFPATRAGLDDFLAYLDSQGGRPAYLLTDLIEEDFTRLLLPHVGGRAGRKLRARRLVQQYRDTPYRTAHVQGRSEEGRRDDMVLFTALTNPLLLTPWVDAMELMQTPLAGIYSTALMGRDVLRLATARHRHILLVTRQAAGLRQTYFRAGAVKFSRLVHGTPVAGPVRALAEETRKTQQFLTSVRLLERGDVLHVVVLADPELAAGLSAGVENGAETIYRIVSVDTVLPAPRAGRLFGIADQPAAGPGGTGATGGAVASATDTLMLSLLARQAPASHYPTGAAGNYYRLWRVRLSLFASSVVLAAAGVAWSVANVASHVIARDHAEALQSETRHYRASYNASMSSMPPTVDKTANMRAAVSIDRMVARQGPWPMQMVGMVSATLERSPQIRLIQLDWRAAVPGAPTVSPGGAPGAAGLVAPTSSFALGIPTAPQQTLRLQAEVVSAPNDYRRVLGEMNAFAQRLAGMPRMSVEIVQLPFDIRPNVKLSGSVGTPTTNPDENKFTLDITWTP